MMELIRRGGERLEKEFCLERLVKSVRDMKILLNESNLRNDPLLMFKI